MTAEFTKDWFYIDTCPMRKISLYKNVRFPLSKDCLFAASPFGGPVAFANLQTCGIDIFNANGEYLASRRVEQVPVRIFWTKCQKLCVVAATGDIELLTVFGKRIEAFNLHHRIREIGIHEILPFGGPDSSGLAIMDTTYHVYIVNSVTQRVVWTLNVTSKHAPTAWTVVSSDEPTNVIVILGEQFFVGSQESRFHPIMPEWCLRSGGKYVQAITSWDNGIVALIHDSKSIQVTTANLSHLMYTLSFDCSPDLRFTWCGTAALIAQPTTRELLFIAAQEQPLSLTTPQLTLPFVGPVWIEPDSDGIRVFQPDETFLITHVPVDLDNVLGIVSDKPGALLFLSYRCFVRGDHTTFTYITSVHRQMQRAVDQCIIAAAHHFDPSLQKELLSAAAFGKATLSMYDPSKFVYISSLLRCLNAIRKLGIPVSFAEVNELSLESLLDRLMDLRHWPIALQVSRTMGIPSEKGAYRVLAHWTHTLLDTATESGRSIKVEELAAKILTQYARFPAVSFADVAFVAFKRGFGDVARLLLEHEEDAAKKVTTLLKFDDVKAAYEVAVKSEIPDLSYMVISHMRKSGMEFSNLLLRQTSAKIYQGYVREELPSALLSVYVQQDDNVRQALYHIDMASRDPAAQQSHFEEAAACFGNMDHAELQRETEFHVDFLKHGVRSSFSRPPQFPTGSVRERFIWAVGHDVRLAEALKKDHHLTDAEVWHWTVEGFIRARKHQALRDLAVKKPHAYLTFVEAAVKNGERELALEFTDKIVDYKQKVQAFLVLGEQLSAAKVASENQDRALMQRCKSSSRSDRVREGIENLMSQLDAQLLS